MVLRLLETLVKPTEGDKIMFTGSNLASVIAELLSSVWYDPGSTNDLHQLIKLVISNGLEYPKGAFIRT